MTDIEQIKHEVSKFISNKLGITMMDVIDHLHDRGYFGGAWQPIETAPKDGGGFIGYQKISDEQYVISACAFYGEFVWINWGEGLNTSANPTHWMPLPAAPKGEKPMTTPSLIYNAIRTPDGTVLVSRSRHDYKTHLDANGKEYMVDGGLDYCRRSANGDEVDLTMTDEQPHSVQREVLEWGTYGKDGKQSLKYIAIGQMDTEHIEAVLDTQPNIYAVYRTCMEKELKERVK